MSAYRERHRRSHEWLMPKTNPSKLSLDEVCDVMLWSIDPRMNWGRERESSPANEIEGENFILLCTFLSFATTTKSPSRWQPRFIRRPLFTSVCVSFFTSRFIEPRHQTVSISLFFNCAVFSTCVLETGEKPPCTWRERRRHEKSPSIFCRSRVLELTQLSKQVCFYTFFKITVFLFVLPLYKLWPRCNGDQKWNEKPLKFVCFSCREDSTTCLADSISPARSERDFTCPGK